MTGLRRIAQRIVMGLGFGRQSADTVEANGTPTVQAVLVNGEVRDGMPFMQHYGLCSRPVPGADLVTVFQAGDRMRGVVIASNDQRCRPKALQPGEVCLYHRSGSMILLAQDGSISIAPSNGKLSIGADVTVDGTIVATGEVTGNGVALSSHDHTGVQTGSGTSGPPQK